MKDAEISKEDRELSRKLGFRCYIAEQQIIANHRAKCAAKSEDEKLAQEFRDNYHRPFKVSETIAGNKDIFGGVRLLPTPPKEQLAAYLNTCEDIPWKD